MVLTITRNQFAVAIDNLYYTILDDPTKGLNAVNLRTLVMHNLNTNGINSNCNTPPIVEDDDNDSPIPSQ